MSTGVEVGFLAKYFGYIVSFLAALGGGKWFWAWKGNKDKEISELRQSIKTVSDLQIQHSNTFLTEDEIRHEIEKSSSNLFQSIEKIECISTSTQEAVRELTAQLREKTAAEKAVEAYRREHGE